MNDSGLITVALLNRLAGDTTLLALMPDGVHFGRAPAGKTRTVIVSLESGFDELNTFGLAGQRTNRERRTYLIKAVERSTSMANTRQAADRIRDLLEDVPLTVEGFVNSAIHREMPIEFVEVDEIDKTISWQHRGGRYRVIANPIPSGN